MRTLVALLAWCYANVLGNLVASAITFAVALGWHHRRVKALVGELHQRFDDLLDGDEAGGGDDGGGA